MTMTKRTFLEAIIGMENISEEVTTFAKAELEKLNLTNEKRRNTLTKTQRENIELKTQFIAEAEIGRTYTASEVGEILGVSTQKASALIRAIAADEESTIKVETTEVKMKKGKVKGYLIVEKEGEKMSAVEVENEADVKKE